MDDEIILNDWNPSEETLRRWAFDENPLLSEQDEDLVLHREEYLPLLIDPAADSTCPKADYILSCLDSYLMFMVLCGTDAHLELVEEGARLATTRARQEVAESGRPQERRLKYREGIGRVSRDQALRMGQELLNGISRQAIISIVAETAMSWEAELSVQPFHRHKERLSIPRTLAVSSSLGEDAETRPNPAGRAHALHHVALTSLCTRTPANRYSRHRQ